VSEWSEFNNLLPRQYKIAMARRFSRQFCMIGIVIAFVVVLAMSVQQSLREGVDPSLPKISNELPGYDGTALAD
jgi:hypothetical protein